MSGARFHERRIDSTAGRPNTQQEFVFVAVFERQPARAGVSEMGQKDKPVQATGRAQVEQDFSCQRCDNSDESFGNKGLELIYHLESWEIRTIYGIRDTFS